MPGSMRTQKLGEVTGDPGLVQGAGVVEIVRNFKVDELTISIVARTWMKEEWRRRVGI